MKAALILSSFLFSSMTSAQSIDVSTFKNLLTMRQATLESVNPGMSKKVTTTTSITTELGNCEIKEVATQTILKIEGDKIIVYSKQNSTPAASAACEGFQSSESTVVFFEAKPSLAQDIVDLENSEADIALIAKENEIVTVKVNATIEEEQANRHELVTIKYDLTKPSFKNIILTQDSSSTTTGEDMADVDINKIDLKNVLFCDSVDEASCVQGDFSDILF